jgi:hypothetical protein
MSKFLLQISKALIYSKIKFLFGKEFNFTFGPIGPAASRPNRGPLIFFSTGHSPSPHWASAPQPARPQPPPGLGLPAGPSRLATTPAQLACQPSMPAPPMEHVSLL